MRKITLAEFETIKSKFSGRNNVFCHWLKEYYSELYSDIISYGSFVSDGKTPSFLHKLIWYLCDIHEYPICPICGKENKMFPNTNLIQDYVRYPDLIKFCRRHYYSSDYYQSKMKEMYLQRYGVDNPNKLQTVKDKIQRTIHDHFGEEGLKSQLIRDKKRKTNLERYGVEYNAQAEVVKDKIKQTFDERYNGHPLRDIDIQHKFRTTCMERFGHEHFMQNTEIKNKVLQTNRDNHNGIFFNNPEKRLETTIQRYGVENISQLDSVKEKKIEKSLDRYGLEYPFQSEEVKDKIKDAMIERYGVDNVSKNEEVHNKQIDSIKKVKREISYSRLTDQNNEVILLSQKEDYLYYCEDKIKTLHWRCQKCNQEFDDNIDTNWPGYIRCYNCHPHIASQPEIDIFQYIKKFDPDASNYRRDIIDRKELDVYSPLRNIAIEFDGLYWHSSLYHDSMYHLNKTIQCDERNIRLIHIFEDEWMFKKDIVLSRLNDIFGNYSNIIYARNCNIKEITHQESRIFLEMNHIQGNCNSNYNIGLFYQNQLVALMTFGSYRKSLGRKVQENEYELLRFCCKLGYHIPGAAGKLLKYFERKTNPKKIISYADRRWSQGKLYRAIGFEFIRYTQPNYFYVIGNKRENRFKWRKSELPKLLSNVDMNLSEEENMKNNGYYKIYDCGHLLFEKSYS